MTKGTELLRIHSFSRQIVHRIGQIGGRHCHHDFDGHRHLFRCGPVEIEAALNWQSPDDAVSAFIKAVRDGGHSYKAGKLL